MVQLIQRISLGGFALLLSSTSVGASTSFEEKGELAERTSLEQEYAFDQIPLEAFCVDVTHAFLYGPNSLLHAKKVSLTDGLSSILPNDSSAALSHEGWGDSYASAVYNGLVSAVELLNQASVSYLPLGGSRTQVDADALHSPVAYSQGSVVLSSESDERFLITERTIGAITDYVVNGVKYGIQGVGKNDVRVQLSITPGDSSECFLTLPRTTSFDESRGGGPVVETSSNPDNGSPVSDSVYIPHYNSL